jgi:single-strand DNA-binding protein
MSFEISGVLHKVMDINERSATFKVREFVLEVPDGQYPQLISFQAIQDRVTIVDSFQLGQRVKVSFDLRGREWNGKYLTNINAWRIVADTGDANSTPAPFAAPAASAPQTAETVVISSEPAADDDLPF